MLRSAAFPGPWFSWQSGYADFAWFFLWGNYEMAANYGA